MIQRTIKGVVYAISGLVSAIVVILALAAWRLDKGPISLDFVTDTIEQRLSAAHDPYRIDIGETVLTWAGWERVVDVRFSDVQVIDADGVVVAQAPELAVGIAPRALLRGILAPSEIEVFRPRVKLVRSADGTLRVAFGQADETSGNLVGEAVKTLLTRDDPDHPMSHLDRVRIVDATVFLEEQGLALSWHGYVPSAQLTRRGRELDWQLTLRVTNGGKSADLNSFGSYSAIDDRFSTDINFASLRPASLASMAPLFAPLASIDIPLKGVVTLLGTAGDGIASAEFDMRGTEGSFALSDAVAEQLGDKAWAQRLNVESLALHGVYDFERSSVDLDAFSVTFADDSVIFLPPVNHAVPVSAVTARVRYADAAKIDIHQLDIDLAGPQVAISGAADLGAEPVRFSADGALTEMPFDDVARYWPETLETVAREWVVTQLSDGVLTAIVVHAEGEYRADGLDLDMVTGTAAASGATVAYFPPLQPATNVDATATFDGDRFSISVLRGAVGDIAVTEGIVVLDHLGSDDRSIADVDVNVTGPLPDVLAVLDLKPLGYAEEMGIDETKTKGQVNSRFRLQFPLVEEVDLDDLAVIVAAEATDVQITTDLFLETLRSPRLHLGLDNGGMDVNGPLLVGSLSGDLSWRENFDASAPFRGRYTLTVPNLNVEDLLKLGFEWAPLVASRIDGPLATTATITEFASGERHIQAAVESTGARVILPYVAWTKPSGVPARMDFEARMQGDRLTEIPKFSTVGEGVSATGSARFDEAGALHRLDVDRLIVDRTNLTGFVDADARLGWKVHVAGDGLDLSHVLGDVDVSAASAGTADDGCPRMAATIDVKTVWLGTDQRLNAAKGNFECDGTVWRSVRVDSATQDGSAIAATVTPEADGTRSLAVRSENAGEALRALGIYENMRGGMLTIDAVFRDDEAGRALVGDLRVRDYHIVNAPGLARLLGAMSLAGMVGALSGDGIAFSRLRAPFRWENDILTLTDARAAGSALGLTASGNINAETNEVAINGTVVPFYMVNSVLGHIPLLGSVLTGGERGGGVFAARYTVRGSLDDPIVSVNPVSALAPGFLRNVFGIFERDTDAARGGATAEPPSTFGDLGQPPQP